MFFRTTTIFELLRPLSHALVPPERRLVSPQPAPPLSSAGMQAEIRSGAWLESGQLGTCQRQTAKHAIV